MRMHHAARSEQASELCFLRVLRREHVTNPLMVRNLIRGFVTHHTGIRG
jgi:hypothetical protein